MTSFLLYRVRRCPGPAWKAVSFHRFPPGSCRIRRPNPPRYPHGLWHNPHFPSGSCYYYKLFIIAPGQIHLHITGKAALKERSFPFADIHSAVSLLCMCWQHCLFTVFFLTVFFHSSFSYSSFFLQPRLQFLPSSFFHVISDYLLCPAPVVCPTGYYQAFHRQLTQ